MLTGSNAAVIAFRKKMIKNLAYAGGIDQISFWGTLLVTGTAYAETNVNWRFINMLRLWLRAGVSFYQLQSIEPASMAGARAANRPPARRFLRKKRRGVRGLRGVGATPPRF